MENIKNKKICIVSYIHESGLYYLSKYFYDKLYKDNDIIWIPKIKYKLKNGRYIRTIERSNDLILPNSVKILEISKYNSFFKNNKFDKIFSFESNTRESWVLNNIKKITDIPMIEWVDFNKIHVYSQFKNIICLNEYTFELLNSYGSCIKIDIDLGFKKYNKSNYYYHQASLNKEYSSKNTLEVIKAFNMLNDSLIITGSLSELEIEMLTPNIKYLGIVSRENILEIYKKAKCLIAPSSSEGLGLHLYEARAHNCKIICSNYNTIKDIGDFIIDLNYNIKDQIVKIIKYNDI